MKSKYLLLAALMFVLAGCSDDGNVTEPMPEGPAAIKVDRTELAFSELGGSEVLNITAENTDMWSAFSKISWIEVGEPDLENGTLAITVLPTEEIYDLTGEVIIHTAAEETVKVAVTQKGNGVIHDRSTAKRMNLHGPVKEVSFYFFPIHQWEYLTSQMRNLKFDRDGQMTYFEYIHFSPPDNLIRYNATLEYDSQSRLVKIDVGSNASVDEAGTIPFEFSIGFEYGNHGKYVETDFLFSWLNERYCYVTHRTWLPKMMKNLTKITINNPITIPNDFGFVWDNTAEAVKLWMLSSGNYQEVDFAKYEFTGDYTHKAIYPYSFLGFDTEFAHIYEVDPATGYILSIKQTDYEGKIGLDLFNKFYTPNLQNTLSRYEDEFDYGYRMDITYNDNFDVTGMDEKYHEWYSELGYEYDDHGNWISVLVSSYPEPFMPVDSERTITYWDEESPEE